MSSSELILYVTIWSLTVAGIFFGGRAIWRRGRSGRK